MVVEVAIYPAKGKSINVSLNDFALQVGSTDHAIKPSSARLLAAELQKGNEAPTGTGVEVSPVMHVQGMNRALTLSPGRRSTASITESVLVSVWAQNRPHSSGLNLS